VTGRFYQGFKRSLGKSAKSVLEFKAQLIAAKQTQGEEFCEGSLKIYSR